MPFQGGAAAVSASHSTGFRSRWRPYSRLERSIGLVTASLERTMFLRSVGSTDPRFRTVRLHDGLNVVVADRMEASGQGESRNGTGKSSLVRILRYLLGGSLPDDFKHEALANHVFMAELELPSRDG